MPADNNARHRVLAELVDDVQAAAAEDVLTKLAPLLPGEAWKGPGEDAQR